MNAPKAGEFATKTAKWVIGRSMVSGTGLPIRETWGVAKDFAIRAAAGGGSKASGGSGMAGGDARLRALERTVTIALASAVILAEIAAQRAVAAKRIEADVALCMSCQRVLPAAESDDTPAPCPHCGHAAAQSEQE